MRTVEDQPLRLGNRQELSHVPAYATRGG
jgi:hypothetical protein